MIEVVGGVLTIILVGFVGVLFKREMKSWMLGVFLGTLIAFLLRNFS